VFPDVEVSVGYVQVRTAIALPVLTMVGIREYAARSATSGLDRMVVFDPNAQ
jgi:hypothetical protein